MNQNNPPEKLPKILRKQSETTSFLKVASGSNALQKDPNDPADLGLFFGLAAVFFLDYLDNTIRTPEDVEKYLGLSVLGVVPKVQELELTHRIVREAFQSLRTSVIFSSKNPCCFSCMTCSYFMYANSCYFSI